MSRKKYTNTFRRMVAVAASSPKATLMSVGRRFDVHPALVRSWRRKYALEKPAHNPAPEVSKTSKEKLDEAFEKERHMPTTWKDHIYGFAFLLILLFGFVLGVSALVDTFGSDWVEDLHAAKPDVPAITPSQAQLDWSPSNGKVVEWDITVKKKRY